MPPPVSAVTSSVPPSASTRSAIPRSRAACCRQKAHRPAADVRTLDADRVVGDVHDDPVGPFVHADDDLAGLPVPVDAEGFETDEVAGLFDRGG